MLLLLLSLVLASSGPVAQDTYDMTTYQMVLLKKGTAPPPAAPADQKRMQDEHLANLAELNRKKINLIYGPILEESDLRGIAVLDVPDADTARRQFADDPFVKAGVMTVEVRPLMAPKGWFHPPAGYDVSKPENLEPLILGFLVRAETTTQDRAAAEEIQKGHLAYMDSLHKQGKLVMAGPLADNGAERGVVVYRVKDVKEAMELSAGDPAVKAGRLRLRAYPWMTFKGILK